MKTVYPTNLKNATNTNGQSCSLESEYVDVNIKIGIFLGKFILKESRIMLKRGIF
jgi:hypothetical protein